MDEGVDRILQGMSGADKQAVRSIPKDDLIQFYFTENAVVINELTGKR